MTSFTPLPLVEVVDTQDSPWVHTAYHQVSLSDLLRRAAAAWGDTVRHSLQDTFRAVFTGYCYDREQPREILVDLERNAFWALCYRRPKRHDPKGEGLVKTLIHLPAALPLTELYPCRVPAATTTDLMCRTTQHLEVSTSRYPLPAVGMDLTQFLVAGEDHRQETTLVETVGEQTTVSTAIHCALTPRPTAFTDSDLAIRVTKRQFQLALQGHYDVVSDTCRHYITYLKELGITPHYQATRNRLTASLGILFALRVIDHDQREHLLTGGCFVTTLRRNDCQ